MSGRFISVAYLAAGKLQLWEGGGLAELRGQRPPSRGKPPGGRRGLVGPFSKASRRRMLRSISRVRQDAPRPTFATFTYPLLYPDAWDCKRHLQAFLKRIRRIHPQACGVWRLEFQDRGAPHVHLIFWNLPWVSWAWLAWHWVESGRPFLPGPVDHAQWMQACSKVERAKTAKGVIGYAAKYAAKCKPEAGPAFVGRRWGWFGRAHVPWATLRSLTIDSWRVFYHVRRAMRRLAQRRRIGGRMVGLTIFCASPVALARLL